MVGCAAAFLLNSPRWRVRIHSIPVWPTLIFTAFFIFALEPILIHQSANHPFFSHLLFLTMPTIEGLVIAASLLVLIAGKHGTAFWIFNLPLMNHFGRLSYSLYIWQQLFLYPQSAKSLIALALRMVLIYVVALSSFHFLEQPFLKLRSRLRRGVVV
jgi:peptidoglycan/LPS O-acetylase OafA/YrhL